MKRHKEPIGASTRNSDAQVFVFPPDILEQLGIQLSGITSGNFTDNSVVDCSIADNEEEMPCSVDGPSILETANLMKQSVFMSPTFVSSSVSENVNELNEPKIECESDASVQETNLTYNDSLKSKGLEQNQSIKQCENTSMVLTNVSFKAENNIDLGVLNKSSSVDDHVDEAYSSDCSNSNPGTGPEITNNNKEVSSIKQNTSTNKIKILSEQVINHSELSTIKSSEKQKSNACFLIPVNTIVTGKATKHTNIRLQAKKKISVTPVLDTDNTIKNEITEENPVVEDSISLIQSASIESNETLSEAGHKIITDFGDNEMTEIDIPLNTEDQLCYFNVNEKKELILYAVDTTKEIVSNNEQTLSKSKLCIQGVEKPGGIHDQKTNQVLKTYQRTNIQKQIPDTLQMIVVNNYVDLNVLPTDKKDLDNIYISGYINANKFCICHDFGQLANYESDIDYEHVHFCNNKSVGCNLETLFSIYDDDYLLRELSVTEEIDTVSDDKETAKHNICWLSYLSDINDEDEECVLQVNIKDEATSEQLRRSNRNRKSIAAEHVTESIELKSKIVKCGVCGSMLSEAEWNKHKDSEHNSIAWKEGQTIDLKNKGLLQKLGLKLKKLGVLKCTFCKADIKYLAKFIQHIKACIKLKIESSERKSLPSNVLMEPAIIKQEDPIKSKKTGSKSFEKDDTTSKSTKKLVNIVSPKAIKKNPGLEDIENSNKLPISFVSSSKPSVKTLEIEVPAKCTRRTRLSKNELTVEKNALHPKSNRKSIDLVSKYTEDKNSSNAEDTPIIKSKKDDSSKVIELKDSVNAEPTTISKSKRTSTEVSAKSTDIKSPSKPETKGTSKSPRRSTEVTSIKVETSESTKKSISVAVTPSKSEQKDVSLKTSRKSIEDVSHSKQSSSKSSHSTASKSDRVDDSNKSNKKNTEAGISEKNIQKSDVATPKRKLKDIDLFSSPTAAKSTKIDSQTKSLRKSKDGSVSSSTENIAMTSKSSSSIDTPAKRPRRSLQIDDSNTKNRKSSDSEANKKTVKAAAKCEEPTKSLVKSADVDVTPKPIRQYTRKSSLNTDITTPTEIKNVTIPKSQLPTPKLKRKSVDIIQADTVSSETERDSNPKPRKKSLLPPVDSTQNLVEIEIPVYSSEDTTTIVNATITTQGLDSLSSYNNKNAITDSNTENSNSPQTIEVSIKKEVIPKCGVCNLAVDESLWIEHIAKVHDYLAWREDETPVNLEDDEEIRVHLYKIVKANGGLTCSKCNLTRKYAKSFLTHIRTCQGIVDEQSEVDASTASVEMDSTLDPDDMPLKPSGVNRESLLHRAVECGVCSETVLQNKWIDHIRMEHKYLAWKKGEPPLDLNDDVAVKDFLKNISKYNGGLICSKCGTTRAYVKKWMDHVATCKGIEPIESSSLDSTAIETTQTKTAQCIVFEIELLAETVKCGKCGKEIESKEWIDHIEKEHNYLSWVEGQTPLDETDQEAVCAFLHALVKKRGSLYCVKCGLTRKYPKAFLTHVSACEVSGFKREDFYVEVSSQTKPGEFECAVCHETGKIKDWKKHAMSKHYNVAWMAGDIPINLKNPYAVEKYIKEYRAKHNLVCKVCGASRASCYGFYAHILTCGKTDEELEHIMEMCDICNNKYLCIYRNQHKTMHKEQMIKKEKKELDAIRAEEEIEAKAREKLVEGEPMGKRRAAEKAKKVMAKYTSNMNAGSHMCLSCQIEFDSEDQLKGHECQGNLDEGSDSDVSVKLEDQEESDDDIEGVDSNISDEDEDSFRRKRQTVEVIPKITLPFKIKDLNYHLSKSFEDYCKFHYTTERLFNKWQSDDFKILSEEESTAYLPSLLESCKLRTVDDEWVTFKRFEAKMKKDMTIFIGASIRCIQWVPYGFASDSQDNYLSVASFHDADCPRYGKDELPEHPGMLQFWNLGQFTTLPKLEMALVHDYGTIWAMDWCPSGARDEPIDTEDSRLGLLAVACSNGCAYIFSVPRFHSIIQNEPIIFKLKPVAELRLSALHENPPSRVRYQATSITWSPQRGHEVVMVGYADGTTAMYDLNTESSILKAKEDGVDIFYPFQDVLAENSTITGVALCASGDVSRAVCSASSSSVTGATMSAWPRGPAVRSHLAASSVAYTPNWPAALLCSDDVLTMKSTNEMQWWGGGRRLGGACAAATCSRCGRVCLTAPPFVRILRAHPGYPDLKKQIVATMKMVPISRKRKHKLVNDDLGMILEPLTYDDAIKKYGLEFKTVPKKDQNVASKLCDNVEQCAERFPLSDMPAAAFCPSAAHHDKLAIASHAGFLFIIST